MTRYRYISADNHLNSQWLPADLWQRRLPARLRERGPQVVETDSGSFWRWEGRCWKASAAGSSWARIAGSEFSDIELPPGALPPSDPALACAHMDLAGVWGAVFFGDNRKWKVEDPELRVAIYQAYNDFLLELTATTGDRLLYLPELPTVDPAAAIAEARRVVALGARGVEFDVFNAGAPLGDEVWRPLWELATDQGIPVCSHTGHAAGSSIPVNVQGRKLASHSVSPFVAARPVADMVFGGVFERHPGLMWVMAESRIGWLPFLFSWMDRQVDIRDPDPTLNLSLRPTDYIRRNVRFTFEDDPVGARLLAEDWSLLGDTVMWGCDYPHPQGMWPDPEPAMARQFAGLDPGLCREIVHDRAARLFGFRPPAA